MFADLDFISSLAIQSVDGHFQVCNAQMLAYISGLALFIGPSVHQLNMIGVSVAFDARKSGHALFINPSFSSYIHVR